ncbi:S8 family serine peptidase [Motilibacter sp. E257]|uniref:S8 family serine peptidase n=1 Tax=Motilibacter deserti TaxID=2714956 RepID=A0ABX0H277_9ACTN|nr:S8 family serine peptidase [Motilibacter deserti]
MRGRAARGVAGAAALAAVLAAATTPASAQAAAAPAAADPVPVTGGELEIKADAGPADKLGGADEQKLAQLRADRETWTTIMIGTAAGKAAEVAAAITKAGGYVRYAAPELDYVSARVKTSNVEKTASLKTVRAVDLDQVIELSDPAPAGGGASVAAAAPGPQTPDDNPYMPTRETGSIAFKQDNPTWDGRGVTIGILDSGVDLGHPSLNTTSTGERKIVDNFSATDPVTEGSLISDGDATWIPMVTAVSGPGATINGVRYTIPTGSYRFRQVVEAQTDQPECEICGDLNRDGDKTDRIGVLWDKANKRVLVDSDDDKDFTDEAWMTPYKESGQVGELGRDNPATAIRESIPFTVNYRENLSLLPVGINATYDFVDIALASGEHGSHVAGIAAGHSFFGGQMDGQAPGAKLVSARACAFGAGCTEAALRDGMVMLALDGVDIINMSIGGLPTVNDADNDRARLYNDIINELGVQIVISAGNSSNALNTVGDPAVASDVVAVGATISRESWQVNYGSDSAYDFGMMPFSSGGPREDGGFKPDITAPGSAIASINTWLPGGPTPESGYSLPPGYAMLQGTSMASPQAAGAMALLLGAAKATNRPVSTSQLRYAVYSTAGFSEGIPAFLQGRGQIDVPAAWAAIKGKRYTSQAFTVSAPTCTAVWRDLGRLGADDTRPGTGLYNRCAPGEGGQAPGESRTYPVTITRTAGPAGSTYTKLSFTGNDGTFSVSPEKLNIALNTPTTVYVTAKPTAGAHSAILQVDDPATRGWDQSMMAVVVAGESAPGPQYTWSTSGVSQRNLAQRYYLTVPEGVKALDVSMTGQAAGSQVRFLSFHPYGVPLDSTSTPNCYPNYGTPEGNGCNPFRRVYSNPTPGVWEFLVESRRTTPLADNPFTLTAKLLGATVTPAQQTVASATVGQPVPLSWTVRNDFGQATLRGQGGPLGSVREERPTVAASGDAKYVDYEITIPAGTTRFETSIGNTTDPQADLDLYLLTPAGSIVTYDADADSEESIVWDNPTPGTYIVEVEGYAVPAGTTQFDYRDAFYAPSLGTLAVTSPAVTLAQGETTTVTGTLTALTAPAAGRTLTGVMNVLNDTGAVLGTGRVDVSAVVAP